MTKHQTKKPKNNKELNQYNEVLENRILLMEQQFKILENKLNISNEAQNQSKNDIQNAKEIPTKNEKIFTCYLCNVSFNKKLNLKDHNKKHHPKVISCTKCKETFDESWKLEIHMKSHTTIKLFSCDHCAQSFYVEWRLEKHIKMHSTKKMTFCHYFNNNKVCPYEEIGCKFHYKKSYFCIKKGSCQIKYCRIRTFLKKNIKRLVLIVRI